MTGQPLSGAMSPQVLQSREHLRILTDHCITSSWGRQVDAGLVACAFQPCRGSPGHPPRRPTWLRRQLGCAAPSIGWSENPGGEPKYKVPAFAAEKVLDAELVKVLVIEPNDRLSQREPVLQDGVEALWRPLNPKPGPPTVPQTCIASEIA